MVADSVERRRSERRILLTLFTGVFLIHLISGVNAGGDSRWVVPTAVSIYRQGDTDLNEYTDLLYRYNYYCTDLVGDHYYSFFSIGSTLMAMPFVYPADLAMTWTFDSFPGFREWLIRMSPKPLERVDVLSVGSRIEWLPASFYVALATVLLYLIGRDALERRYALFLALLFAFASPAWSTASRAMLQHGPMMLVLALTLWIFGKAEKRPWLIQFTGAVLAFGYVIRPTGSIPLALLSAYVLVKYHRYALPYALWAVAVLVPMFSYYYSVYGTILPPYYLPSRLGETPFFWEALVGNLVSPARGMLTFTPVFLFSLVGIGIKISRRAFGLLDALLCGIVVLHWLAVSAFWQWWGGHSYGPRYLSDMTPIFVYFLIPVLQGFQSSVPLRRGLLRGAYTGMFFLCATFSAFVHFHGATDVRAYNWNWDPVNVDDHPERLWDWTDPQFLRGILPRVQSGSPCGPPLMRDLHVWEHGVNK